MSRQVERLVRPLPTGPRTDDVRRLRGDDGLARGARSRPTSAPCLIHNDFRFDNVVLDPDDPKRIVGVLDWEMATVGDPLMDLGGALAYWVQADDDPTLLAVRRQPTHLPGMLTRDEVVDRYAEATRPRRHPEHALLRGVRRSSGSP